MAILKRLFWTFLISTTPAMLIACSIYSSESGLEARQGVFILLIMTAALCILNFLLSLAALFNLNKVVRGHVVLSALAFLGLPALLLLLLSASYAINRNRFDDPALFMMLINPSLFTTGLLSYHFYRFRQRLATSGTL